jgi:hypothetical protein
MYGVTPRNAIRMVTRFVLATVLFANAIAPGICAALCSAKVCCPPVAAARTNAPAKCCAHACSRCRATKAAGPQLAAVVEQPNCCAWIGQKSDPPGTLAKLVAGCVASSIAVLPRGPVLEAVPLEETATAAPFTEGRAPPGQPAAPCKSRAPPTR